MSSEQPFAQSSSPLPSSFCLLAHTALAIISASQTLPDLVALGGLLQHIEAAIL
jgi:hypothetical protein